MTDRLVLVQGPQDPVVSLAEIKAHCRIDTTASDAHLTALGMAATAYLDGPSGILSRALKPQTWRLELPSFPVCGIRLPLPPTIAVDAVEYLDTNGDLVTLDPAAYRTIPGGVYEGDLIVPAIGYSWPGVFDGQPDGASVTFTAGYVSLSSPENEAVPEPIRVAILMLVQSWHDKGDQEIPEVVGSLIATYRHFLG